MALTIDTLIDKAPIIFLRVAEYQSGEIDGIIKVFMGNEVYPNADSFINFTRVHEIEPTLKVSPRKIAHDVFVSKLPGDHWEYVQLSTLFLDFERERNIQIGWDFRYPNLKEKECYVPE